MIRVLVCEDSATCRALLVEILRSAPEFEVVGEAAHGAQAVALTTRLRPDVVTMDVAMPRMDGLSATREIMIAAPTPVVIVTALTRHADTALAMEALRAGALAVVEKPLGPLDPNFATAATRLKETVRAMSQVKVVRHFRPAAAPTMNRPPGVRKRRIVAIAASTGGPAALQAVLSGLPDGFPLPLLLVQHITPGFTASFTDWLGTTCHLRVKLAEHGESLRAGTVYVSPEERHLGVADGHTILLSPAPPLGGFRPSATFLFESVAAVFGAGVIALILTGMGDDGVAGLRHVRRAGGYVLAQDERSCVVYGMPGAAADAGLVHQSLSPGGVPAHLLALL